MTQDGQDGIKLKGSITYNGESFDKFQVGGLGWREGGGLASGLNHAEEVHLCVGVLQVHFLYACCSCCTAVM